MKNIWLQIIMLCYCIQVMAQQTLIQGLVLSGEHMLPLENVNIQNKGRHTLATSNKSGHFFIHAGKLDTLTLTAIGYRDNIIPVHQLLSNPGALVVTMQPVIYELGEVTINQLGTYDQFKRNVLSLKLPPPVDYMALLNLPKASPASLVPAEYDYRKVYHPLAAIGHPVTFLYKRFNKEEQAKINHYRFITDELPVITVIDKKYNGGRVSAITGLEEDSLFAFMAFCNFDRNYLYVTSEYDIGLKITEKLKEFRLQNRDIRKPE